MFGENVYESCLVITFWSLKVYRNTYCGGLYVMLWHVNCENANACVRIYTIYCNSRILLSLTRIFNVYIWNLGSNEWKYNSNELHFTCVSKIMTFSILDVGILYDSFQLKLSGQKLYSSHFGKLFILCFFSKYRRLYTLWNLDAYVIQPDEKVMSNWSWHCQQMWIFAMFFNYCISAPIRCVTI